MALLNQKARQQLSRSDFALSADAKAAGEAGRYPLPDISHARNALARVAQHGTPEEQKRVKVAVYARYPELDPTR